MAFPVCGIVFKQLAGRPSAILRLRIFTFQHFSLLEGRAQTLQALVVLLLQLKTKG